MANTINPVGVGSIGPVKPGEPTPLTKPADKIEGRSFKELLLDNLDEVNRLQLEADRGVQRLLTGETDNVAEVFNTVNKAGIAFDLLMEIRNKLEEAYREVRQMQV